MCNTDLGGFECKYCHLVGKRVMNEQTVSVQLDKGASAVCCETLYCSSENR